MVLAKFCYDHFNYDHLYILPSYDPYRCLDSTNNKYYTQ